MNNRNRKRFSIPRSILILFSLCVMFREYASGESLTWDVCVKEALKRNPDLVSASESIRQSEAGVLAARSSLRPDVSAKASTGRSGAEGAGSDSSYSYGVSASQLVYDGGKALSSLRQSQEQLQVSKFSYDLASANVRRNLRLAFVALLKAQRRVVMAGDILSRRKQSTKLIRLRYEGGREHRGSLLTAEANEAQSEFDLTQARRSVVVAQSNLKELLGRPAGADSGEISVDGAFAAVPVDKVKPDFVKLAESTPLVKELQAQGNAARLGEKKAKADYYPSVSASAGASRSASDWPPGEDQWSAGISMSLPLFDGGSRAADLDRAKSVVRKADADEKSGFLGAASALYLKWIGLQNAIDGVLVRDKFLEAARERSRIAGGQYAASLIVFDSWIIIENDFVAADQALLEAQAAALIAEAEWIQAKGGTLENESK